MADQPKGFNEKDFRTFLKDDDALIRASKATWLLLPATATYHVNAGWSTCSLVLSEVTNERSPWGELFIYMLTYPETPLS